MPITENGEVFYTAKEAAKFLNISRETFYNNVKDRLQPYTVGVLKRIRYKETDLEALKGIRPIEPTQPE
ncbi:MAG TPA: helix-turn-helix domain-containing protein [Ktedonobacteraceae bacterium]|jgi:excisionase family DNA binding protein|nr:helix-turn-helix domain-containing protein [Ktedonobacteraceae bacterium]